MKFMIMGIQLFNLIIRIALGVFSVQAFIPDSEEIGPANSKFLFLESEVPIEEELDMLNTRPMSLISLDEPEEQDDLVDYYTDDLENAISDVNAQMLGSKHYLPLIQLDALQSNIPVPKIKVLQNHRSGHMNGNIFDVRTLKMSLKPLEKIALTPIEGASNSNLSIKQKHKVEKNIFESIISEMMPYLMNTGFFDLGEEFTEPSHTKAVNKYSYFNFPNEKKFCDCNKKEINDLYMNRRFMTSPCICHDEYDDKKHVQSYPFSSDEFSMPNNIFEAVLPYQENDHIYKNHKNTYIPNKYNSKYETKDLISDKNGINIKINLEIETPDWLKLLYKNNSSPTHNQQVVKPKPLNHLTLKKSPPINPIGLFPPIISMPLINFPKSLEASFKQDAFRMNDNSLFKNKIKKQYKMDDGKITMGHKKRKMKQGNRAKSNKLNNNTTYIQDVSTIQSISSNSENTANLVVQTEEPIKSFSKPNEYLLPIDILSQYDAHINMTPLNDTNDSKKGENEVTSNRKIIDIIGGKAELMNNENISSIFKTAQENSNISTFEQQDKTEETNPIQNMISVRNRRSIKVESNNNGKSIEDKISNKNTIKSNSTVNELLLLWPNIKKTKMSTDKLHHKYNKHKKRVTVNDKELITVTANTEVWSNIDTVASTLLSSVGQHMNGIITLCSETTCHSIKCGGKLCLHRLCEPIQRYAHRGHCAVSYKEDKFPRPNTKVPQLKSIFDVVEILEHRLLPNKAFGKATFCNDGFCETVVATNNTFVKEKCPNNLLESVGHCKLTASPSY